MRSEDVISSRTWHAARLAGGAAILGVLVWRVGAGPFLDGLRLTSPWAVAAAAVVTAVGTVCCAWRWRLVAAGLGVNLSLQAAIGGYYRSQFLNATLPGGVLGDVHRGVRHGREVDDLSRGLRSVVWERTAGQTVQVLVTATVVIALAASGGARVLTLAGLAFVAVAAGVCFVVRRSRAPMRGRDAREAAPVDAVSRGRGLVRTVSGDLRAAVLTRRAGPGIVIASVIVVAGHVAVFAIAVRSTGTEMPPGRLALVALVVLQAAALPTNIAGWGPREGASAWAFGAVGLGAATGVTVAVVYGVLALLATLPGAVLLVTDWRGGRRGRARAAAVRGDDVAQSAPPLAGSAAVGLTPRRRAEGGIHA